MPYYMHVLYVCMHCMYMYACNVYSLCKLFLCMSGRLFHVQSIPPFFIYLCSVYLTLNSPRLALIPVLIVVLLRFASELHSFLSLSPSFNIHVAVCTCRHHIP